MGKLDSIGIGVVVVLLVVIIVVSFFDGKDDTGTSAQGGNGQMSSAEGEGGTSGSSRASLSANINNARKNGQGTRKISPIDISNEDDDENGPGKGKLTQNGGKKAKPGTKPGGEIATPPNPVKSGRFAGFPKEGVLAEGQQLWNVIVKTYGSRVGPNMIDRVLEASKIADDTRVREGTKLVFPKPSADLLARIDNTDRKKSPNGTKIAPKGATKSTPPKPTRRRFLWEPEGTDRSESGNGTRTLAAHEYVVKRGETLSEIAEKQLGSMKRWTEIMKLNNVTKPENVRAGDILKLPAR